ncbi:MAG: polyprenyl synthetase family protein [Muribaculaceae bacterium]|nr:polyprenyl synthetase family protein [Muribaculaceae bacterium]
MALLDEIGDFINTEIESIAYPEKPVGLYDPIRYTLEGGGKRLRPTLLLASCHAFCGDYRRAVKQAVGIEMYHNFTLLHDDVMDRSAMRRGKPTVHVKWNEATAILSGDTMLTMASQLIAENAKDKTASVVDIFNRMGIEVAEGQQFDMDFEKRDDVTLDEYLEMIRLKTSVLLGCACEIGAIMGDASPEDAARLRDMAIDMGIAFQLQDDYLDTFGDPATFGKRIGGDILNAKKTALLIIATSRDASLLSIINRDIPDDDKIRKVSDIYVASGATGECRRLIGHYSEKAVKRLDEIAISSESKAIFRSIIQKSAVRNV